mgnify:CR=1 FL=1
MSTTVKLPAGVDIARETVITGRVLDGAGRPIGGAAVRLRGVLHAEGLRPRVLTVTPGWSEAYGLFLSGEVDMALAYTTSPAYHLIAEGDDGKRAAMFDEGHYMQIEVAARTAASDQPDLAREFLAFMLTDGFQDKIPTTNWMYPARTPAAGLPEGYETLAVPAKPLLLSPEEARAAREPALDEWLRALSR